LRENAPITWALAPLKTARLNLEPISVELARAIVAGDLTGLKPAVGWPHEATRNGVAAAVKFSQPTAWLITCDGLVIGDCGIHGPVDDEGGVEIGYGLAAPRRGLGYGTEVVAAITAWLISRPCIRTVRASTSQTNVASRQVLEKAGFKVVAIKDEEILYEHCRSSSTG
jgi:RimJ/RimL family protein N-acetyltransferase